MIANINKVAQNETKYGSNCLTPVRSHTQLQRAFRPESLSTPPMQPKKHIHLDYLSMKREDADFIDAPPTASRGEDGLAYA